MAARAGGWLRWTEAEARRSDVVYLENALSEHAEIMGILHLGAKPRDEVKPRVTSSLFKAFAKDHNATYSGANDG